MAAVSGGDGDGYDCGDDGDDGGDGGGGEGVDGIMLLVELKFNGTRMNIDKLRASSIQRKLIALRKYGCSTE